MTTTMFLRRIHSLAVTALAALMAASCTTAADDDGGYGDGTAVTVAFTLAVGDEQAPTRAAAWGDTYAPDETGSDTPDNHIDPQDVQILLYTADNRPLGKVENIAVTVLQTGEYRYVGSLPVSSAALSDGKLTAKMVVFANFKDKKIDESKSLDELENSGLTFSYDADRIPMWGVATLTDKPLAPGVQTDLGEICLLRAMAKVEVKFADEFTDKSKYTITGITLNNCNTTGNCLPAGFAAAGQTKALAQEGCINPNADSRTTALPFNKYNYIYIPEYQNIGSGSPSTITVNLTNTETNRTDSYTLYFKNYTNGSVSDTEPDYNIVRNHIYRYEITGVDDDRLIINYLVRPWDDVVSSKYGVPVSATLDYWDWGGSTGIDIEPVYCHVSYPRFLQHYSTGLNEGLEDRTSIATFCFTLRAPAGAKWVAHLTNTEDFGFAYYTDGSSKDEFRGESFKDTEGKLHVNASMGTARELHYMISIKANNKWTNCRDANKKLIETFESADKADSRIINTDWGETYAEPKRDNGGIYTDFYITVDVDGEDGEPQKIKINPPMTDGKEYFFKDNRRFAGDDDYTVRIWQLKVDRRMSYQDMMKSDVNMHKYLKPEYVRYK